jgi:hypothetical protein
MNPNVVLMTLVIALEPIPILGGVLLLTAKRGRPKAVGFLLGWALALAIIGVAIVVAGGEITTSSGSTSSKASATVDIVLGLVLALVGFRTRAKARQGADAGTPGWMKRLDTMSPGAAFVLGAFLPPYLIAAAIGNEIVRDNLTTQERLVAVIMYVVVGSIGILVPILVTVFRPDTSEALLAKWREWLQLHWQMVMFWLLLGIGAYLVIKGIIEFAH